MSKFAGGTGSGIGGKPVSLVVTATVMFLAIVAAGVLLIARRPESPYLLVALVFVLAAGAGFLWFYWNGYSWTRYLILFTSVLSAIDAFFGSGKLPSFYQLGAHRGGKEYLNLFWVCFSIYLFCWLLAPGAKKYFSTEARQERKSLKAFRRLASPVLR